MKSRGWGEEFRPEGHPPARFLVAPLDLCERGLSFIGEFELEREDRHVAVKIEGDDLRILGQ